MTAFVNRSEELTRLQDLFESDRAELGVDERTAETHVDGLAACELVRTYPDSRVRITITGEELLAPGTDDLVTVDSE